MDKKLKLDVFKALLDAHKTKLLLFASALGGSVAIMIKSDNIAILGIFAILGAIMLIGVFINLVKFNKLVKEIEELRDER